MIKDYDLVFLKHIKKVYSNTQYADAALVYNTAFQLVDLDTSSDSDNALKFPLINIYRPSGFELAEFANYAAFMQGLSYFDATEDSDKIGVSRLTYVHLPYQIDIYAKSSEDLSDITQQVIQYLKYFNTIEVEQADRINESVYKESYFVRHVSGPTEQSEFSNNDRVYHYALVYQIDTAAILDFTKHVEIEEAIVEFEIDEDIEV